MADKKHIPILDVRDLTHWGGKPGQKGGRDLDIKNDSYVLGFTGPRGAGKTLAMTAFACKAMMGGHRVISNYSIAFKLAMPKGGYQYYESETLDMYKLLVFDTDFQNAVILMDEAPLLISHLASQSWKNRLIDIFLTQLRKNRNSLFYCSQNERWVDTQLRWQTDVYFKCSDMSRRMGGKPSDRGKTISMKALDQSGQWTGFSFEEYPAIHPLQLRGKKFFKIYDTYEAQDIFESLAKVDTKFTTYKIDARSDAEKDESHLDKAEAVLNAMRANGGRATTKEFYTSVGEINASQKDQISKYLKGQGVTRGRQSNGDYYYDFSGVEAG